MTSGPRDWRESLFRLISRALGNNDVFRRFMQLLTTVLVFTLAVVAIAAIVVIVRGGDIARVIGKAM